MIVTCPNCSTKFNLPETQAAPGAKLRCSVCKHVFQLSDGVKPAEIRMEPDLSLSSPSLSMPPKKKGGAWGWVLTLLLLCAVAGGTWWAWTYTPLFDTVKEMIAPPKKQDRWSWSRTSPCAACGSTTSATKSSATFRWLKGRS